MSGPSSRLTVCVITRRGHLAFLDSAQQVIGPAVDVGLPGAHREPLFMRRRTGSVPRPPYTPESRAFRGAADVDHLADHVRRSSPESSLLRAVQDRVGSFMPTCDSMPTARCISRSIALAELVRRSMTFPLEVDGDGPPRAPWKGAPHAVDGDDLLRRRTALRMHIFRPTGAPDATVSVGWMSHCTAACHPVGRCRREEHLLVREPVRDLTGPTSRRERERIPPGHPHSHP